MHKQATPAVRRRPKRAAVRVDSPVGAKSLPQKYFRSAEIFAQEQERIFAREWLLIGHQTQIARPGDYFIQTVAGESLIIIRDKNGAVRGFFNVCRHRGSRLIECRADEAGGNCVTIQCPYHAWTYGLDGRLIGAPHMDDVPGFDKADYPLHEVNLGLWDGFIFVNLANNRTPLDKWFAPLTGKFSHWNMSILRPVKRIDYDVHANWKLMFENYSECYHCPGVHPQLQKVSPYDSAENDLREGPFLGGFMKINAGKSLTVSGNACAAFVGKMEDLQQVFYYSIFPNMFLSLHPEYVIVHQLWPQSPERTLIVCDWLFHPDAARAGQAVYNPDDAIEFWDMT
ncbi:MAG: aromatic ring-hydroxylating dioxygenase subunit alpha, partial [Verrucomicrobia bacterium]|nr:aromatic ring-hydroxylating dioxygenase subunit alpha [Verrucomicrobiota bacterium]